MYTRKTQSWRKHADFMLLDMVVLQLAFVLADWTWHGVPVLYGDPVCCNLSVVLLLADFVVLMVNRTMTDVLRRSWFREMEQTVRHAVLVMVLAFLCLFSILPAGDHARCLLCLTTLYYISLGYLTRLGWKWVLCRRKRVFPDVAVYFLTTRQRAERVLARFRENCTAFYVIQGLCILDENCVGQKISGVPVTASGDTLLNHLRNKWVDEVFVSLPEDHPMPTRLLSALVGMGLVLHIEAEQPEWNRWRHQPLQTVAGATVRTISMTMTTPMQAFLKRLLDIAGGFVGCVLTVVLTFVIGPMIYINSPGPIFFTQTRVGKNGRKFRLYKFRSMCVDAEQHKRELLAQNRIQSGLMFKVEYDPRIIGCERRPDGTIHKGIGNFIRDYSLDEFPQFFNVLRGDLSLCGTRPPTVEEWEKYDLHHRARLAIKPGITGLWQVSGRSNITDFEQVVALDKKYIQEWSMGLDFRILLRTVKVVLHREGSM